MAQPPKLTRVFTLEGRGMTRSGLTKQMRAALRDAVRCKLVQCPRPTLNALVSRHLMDAGGCLTHSGWLTAVEMLPLEEQCREMGLGFERLTGLAEIRHPERAVWDYYQQLGYVGGYCEGGVILLLIRAAALPVLAGLNTFGSHDDACRRYTEAQMTIHADSAQAILDAIRHSEPTGVGRAFDDIYRFPSVREHYPDLTRDAMVQLYRSMGSDTLTEIAAAIMEQPYNLRSGWPDLTMTNGHEIAWIEVKTTDRLHNSQIFTLDRMMPMLPGRVGVVKVSSSPSIR